MVKVKWKPYNKTKSLGSRKDFWHLLQLQIKNQITSNKTDLLEDTQFKQINLSPSILRMSILNNFFFFSHVQFIITLRWQFQTDEVLPSNMLPKDTKMRLVLSWRLCAQYGDFYELVSWGYIDGLRYRQYYKIYTVVNWTIWSAVGEIYPTQLEKFSSFRVQTVFFKQKMLRSP